jgi:hypothetical protein
MGCGESRNLDTLLGYNFVLYYISFYISTNDENCYNKKGKNKQIII